MLGNKHFDTCDWSDNVIFTFATTSAYDNDEVELTIHTENGETVKIGDVITIPMTDHSFVEREITGMYRDWKKRKKGKEKFTEIHDGEWAECIIHNIRSEKIYTVSSLYDDDSHEGAVPCALNDWIDDNNRLQAFLNVENDPMFPKKCPICGHQSGHLYYHLHSETHAGIWAWCSSCKSFSHYSGYAPIWWKNPSFIEVEKLCAVPDYLDDKSNVIDQWLNELLNSRE